MAHQRVYIGDGATAQCKSRWNTAAGWYVLGHAFGPCLYANCSGLEEAFDEFDERHGTRVDFEHDLDTLRDYDGNTVEQQVESAMNDGDIRVNDSGTMVWVDHYEWCEGPFATLSDTLRAIRRTKL